MPKGNLVETVNPITDVLTTHKVEDYADLVFQIKTAEAQRMHAERQRRSSPSWSE